MYGTYSHSMDAKGRLFFPAKFREKMGDTVYMCPATNGSYCISVYSEEGWTALTSSISADRSEAAREAEFALFSNADDSTCDANGRIIINQNLREYANLSKTVKIIGLADHVEIWSEETLTEDRKPLSPKEIKQIFGKLGL